MTYDTDKVDALLRALDKLHLDERDDFQGDVVDAIVALKPQPEMEYVLPEWDRFSSDHAKVCGYSDIAGHFVVLGGGHIYQRVFEIIREYTRRPKQDKVLPGSEWSDADLNELFKAYALSSRAAVFPSGIRAVIDAIKSKCGV